MKTRNIFIRNTKIQGEQAMSIKQAEFIEYLFMKKSIENPFTSRKDMKSKLSKREAKRTIDGILKSEEIVWIIPGE